MARGRYQQKQWDTRENAILEALEKLSMVRGFANVTMDDLADAVGISKATLYQHFAGKDAMLVTLMARHEDRFMAWLAQSDGQPPVERLCATLRYVLDEHITPLRGLVSLRPEDLQPVFRSSPELMERHERIISALTGIVEQGQAQGSIARDLAPDVILGAMLALSSVSVDFRGATSAAHVPQMIVLFRRAIRLVD